MQKKLIALAVATLASVGAQAAFDANIEFDNLYQNNNSATAGAAGLTQSGRVELNASGKVGTDGFVAGRASFLANKNGSATTDDMWVQLGTAAADVKLGRFEAADLFPIPRDAYIPDAKGPAAGYKGQSLRGRFGGNLFHGAVNVNAIPGLGLELGVVESKNNGDLKGVRPVATFMSGPLMLRAGFESAKKVGSAGTNSGYGFTGSYNLGGITLSGNIASAKLKSSCPLSCDQKSTTYGLFVNTDMGLAAGYIASKDTAPSISLGDWKTNTVYAAYTMPLFDLKGASMTTAVASSKAAGTNTTPTINGVKVRFNYAF